MATKDFQSRLGARLRYLFEITNTIEFYRIPHLKIKLVLVSL